MQNNLKIKPFKASDLITCLMIFLTTISILLGFRIFYAAGYGKMVPEILGLPQLLWNGFAALAFYIFLSKSPKIQTLSVSKAVYILLSLSYGFSSYAILQETSLRSLSLFALLPILYLSYEYMIEKGDTLYFLLILTICLSIDAVICTALMIFLVFALFCDFSKSIKALFDNLIQLFLMYILALLISGIFSIPFFHDFFSSVSANVYSGFHLTYPLSNFSSRFFIGALTSALFPQARGINLYFGLFFLLLLFLYFFNQAIDSKQRRKKLIFLFVILCSIECSPLQYIFELFSVTNYATVSYAFFLIFWGLKLAVESLAKLKSIKKIPLFTGIFVFVLFALFVFSGSSQNFHSVSLLSNCIFITLYILCILYFYFQSTEQLTALLLPCLVILELFCNVFITTNQNFIPKSFILQDQFIWSPSTESAQMNTPLYAEEYNTFLEQCTDTQLTNTIIMLLDNVELTEDERLKYNNYGLLDFFEEMNAICYKIGADQSLFTPADIEISYPVSDYYQITDQGNNLYNIYQYANCTTSPETIVPFQISSSQKGTLVLYDNFAGKIYKMNIEQDDSVQNGYLSFLPQPEISLNFQLTGCYLNEDLFYCIPEMLKNYLALQYQDPASHSLLPNYIGLAFSCMGILLFLLFYLNQDRKTIYNHLSLLKESLLNCNLWKHLHIFWNRNRIYCYAFLLPTLLYILCMILFSCIPFGMNSFYDQDGMSSTLPTILDYYYNLKKGNTIFSMNGGYGYCLYNNFPIGILEYPLAIFSPSQVAVLVLFLEALSMGFCSFSVVYYLTHRLTAAKALKSDFRMLIPAFIYALNTYMLAMHGFVTWYYTFLMFPLLLLAMDYLMYRKKWMMYTILLSLCICTNIQLALYICIFLIIIFFTYHFETLKDFLFKGIRFALCSILAACNGFFSISNTLLATSDSMYKNADSIFPSLGFHTSFWEQWKQLMILSDSTAVNHDDGGINIYMGILVLFLILVYFCSKKYSLKEKLRKLIPAFFLLISFNGQVSSFIWNGFHYQSNVPNRHVFLFMFLCAAIAYDGLRALKTIELKKYSLYAIILIIFFCLCNFISDGNSLKAFITTICLVLIYWILHFIYKRNYICQIKYQKILTVILFLELSVNMLYTVSNYGLNTIVLAGSYEEQAEYNNKQLQLVKNAYRVTIPGSYQLNPGSMYDAPTGSLFNSYVTAHQSNLNFHYGFASGVNYTVTNYNNTPLGLALTGTKYCFVPIYSALALPDLVSYEYLGRFENNYIFEVPHTLPLGFYAPEEVLNLHENSQFIPYFWNDFVSLYTSDDSDLIYELQLLEFDNNLTSAPNTYYFSDINHSPISCEEADGIIDEMAATTSSQVIRDLHLNINISPETAGNIYLYMNEFIPLGYIGQATDISMAYPNPTPASPDYCYYVTFNEQIFEEFVTEASKNQLEDIEIEDNHITGITDYDQDGYTVLSLAYDRNWTAYLDGEKIEILDPYNSFMVLKTPAGKHTIELIYTPYGMKASLIITSFSIVMTLTIYIISIKKKGNKKQK